jgi:hypothetical protein
MAHTPGPWKAEDSFGTLGLKNIFDNDGEYIGGVRNSDDNARLIAAAPDLLEACEAALEMWTNGASVGDWQRNSVKLIAAIAKAKGDMK